MECHRRLFHCLACSTKVFDDAESFVAHLQITHPSGSPTGVQSIIDASSRPIAEVSIEACPLCDDLSLVLGMNTAERHTTTISLDLFEEHLGRHQERLALFAFTPDLEREIGLENANQKSATLDKSSEHMVSERYNPSQMSDQLPDQEDSNPYALEHSPDIAQPINLNQLDRDLIEQTTKQVTEQVMEDLEAAAVDLVAPKPSQLSRTPATPSFAQSRGPQSLITSPVHSDLAILEHSLVSTQPSDPSQLNSDHIEQITKQVTEQVIKNLQAKEAVPTALGPEYRSPRTPSPQSKQQQRLTRTPVDSGWATFKTPSTADAPEVQPASPTSLGKQHSRDIRQYDASLHTATIAKFGEAVVAGKAGPPDNLLSSSIGWDSSQVNVQTPGALAYTSNVPDPTNIDDTKVVYPCNQYACLSTFARLKDVQRHLVDIHYLRSRIYSCTMAGCDFHHPRADKKHEHENRFGHVCVEIVNPELLVPPQVAVTTSTTKPAEFVPVQAAPGLSCLYTDCHEAFVRKADLARHIAAVHALDPLEFDCNVSGCHRKGAYGFARKGKLIEHMRDVHKVDIPKKRRNP